MVTKRISSLPELKELARDNWFECRLLLAGGSVFSRKEICFDSKTQKFLVYNSIDDTNQEFTSKQLMDTSCTNVGNAIAKGALVYDTES
jgi:hypothetical protein